MNAYIGVITTFVFAALLTGFFIFLTSVLGPKKRNALKDIPYEAGKDPFALPGKMRFPVHFYVIAMIFIIFDVEIAFLFPWAVLFRELGWTGFLSVAAFVFFIVLAYVYAWKSGALEVN